jgi:HTH-type transcriptional regulator/antitoxin HipB
VLEQPTLGKIIRHHRKKSGLSQAELAQIVGVGKTVVFDLEKGKETVQLSTLNKILNGLNIKVKLESDFMKTLDLTSDETNENS